MQRPRADTGRALATAVRFALLCAVFFAGGGSLLGACGGPRYPSCDNDEQCKRDTHKGGCGKGQECRAGACAAVADYCEDDKGCGSGSSCGKDHRCAKEVAVAPAVEC